jgi:FkbM family methyltransferase
MGSATAPVGLPTTWKAGIFRALDRVAQSPRGQRVLSKLAEVTQTSLGAGNHDDEGERTGENRLISALATTLPAMVALDVGANNGSWTLEMRGRCPRAKVISVEPGSHAVANLSGRTKDDAAVRVVPAAIGPDDTTVTLFGTDASGLQASLRPELLQRTTYTDAGRDMPSEAVRMVSVPSLIALLRDDRFLGDGDSVSVVKIDTEGFELDIITLLMESEWASSIQAIQFEFHMHALAQGHLIDDFGAALGDEFCLFRLAPRDLIPRDDLDPALANYFGFSNWVALRRAIAPQVRAAYQSADPRMVRRPEWRS